VTGDIVITTDADTLLHPDFIKHMIVEFKNKEVVACAGYVKSIKHNWLTSCRQLEYLIGQEVHKYAQSDINALFVIPGCASAFRTKVFKKHISFDHDTLTEDLDFTYKHHRKNLKIAYTKKAIAYTQDPASLKDYVSQLRRWYAGSWQNLIKHRQVLEKPNNALELSLIFGEGVIFPLLLVLALIFNIKVFMLYYLSYFAVVFLFAFYHAFKDKRWDLVLVSPIHLFVSFINYEVFIEQFVLEVLLNKNNLV
jgi:cellulose synthase/poly-beta-1,6-N-acetylglucosamine synthase-like glycosyltransferase